jgi:ATP-dependent DNA helicase RecG
VVAAIAALRAIDAGHQAVLMAPTEILAEQHFQKLAQWIEALGVPVAWLTGGLTKRGKASARDAIESGIARLAIGTHALIQEDVHFANLGLAIVDEQHRFGVGQRLALRFKARSGDAMSREPHQLMMSATPIPRTLAMTYFADLDVSTIDQLPPGRRPIVTRVVDAARRDEVIARVRTAIAEGRGRRGVGEGQCAPPARGHDRPTRVAGRRRDACIAHRRPSGHRGRARARTPAWRRQG